MEIAFRLQVVHNSSVNRVQSDYSVTSHFQKPGMYRYNTNFYNNIGTGCILCSSLSQFFARLWLPFTVDRVDLTLRATQSSTGKTTVKNLYELEAANLGHQGSLYSSL